MRPATEADETEIAHLIAHVMESGHAALVQLAILEASSLRLLFDSPLEPLTREEVTALNEALLKGTSNFARLLSDRVADRIDMDIPPTPNFLVILTLLMRMGYTLQLTRWEPDLNGASRE